MKPAYSWISIIQNCTCLALACALGLLTSAWCEDTPVDAAKVQKLIGDLGNEAFDVRQEAVAALGQLGEDALPLLKKAREDVLDPEVLERLDKLVAEWVPGGLMWQVNCGGPVYGAPAIHGGVVYATVGGRLRAMQLSDGKDKWDVDLDGFIAASPTVHGELVLVGDGDDHLRALACTDGSERWRADTGGITAFAPLVMGERVFVVNRSGEIHAFALADGKPAWTYKGEGFVGGALAGAGELVFLAHAGGDLVALKAADGQLAWTFKAGTPLQVAPVVFGKEIYVAADDGRLFAVAIADGKKAWDLRIGGGAAQLAAGPGRVYGAFDKKVVAVDTKTHRKVWDFSAGKPFEGVAVLGRQILAGSRDGKLYGLDDDSGKKEWTCDVAGGVSSAVALARDRVIVGGFRGHLIAARTGSKGPAEWPTAGGGMDRAAAHAPNQNPKAAPEPKPEPKKEDPKKKDDAKKDEVKKDVPKEDATPKDQHKPAPEKDAANPAGHKKAEALKQAEPKKEAVKNAAPADPAHPAVPEKSEAK